MRKPKVEKDTSERWTVTYSDLMNLLLIVFIILYSSSKLDAQKAQQVSQSLNQGFSTMQGTAAAAGQGKGGIGKGGTDATGSDLYWEADQYGEFYTEITQLLQQDNLQDKVDTTLDDTGVIISFKDNVLFAQGSATINNDGVGIIDQIGTLLTKLDFSFILVEGHTDSDPISTARFTDNMDLSSARAGNVWRELVKCGLQPSEMASIGYGEYRPVAPNDTPENKSKNRRVVVTILKKPFKATTDLSAEQLPQQGTASQQSQASASQQPQASASSASPKK